MDTWAHGQWGTQSNGLQGVWATWIMGHMGYGVQGYGAHGQWGTGVWGT